MKKTISNTYTKSLLHMAAAATVAGVFAAPAFADNNPQEFHAKVNISTDNTCSLTITPGTTDYNSTLNIDTGERTAAYTDGSPKADIADLTTVAYSTGCTFTGISQTIRHTSAEAYPWTYIYNSAQKAETFMMPVGTGAIAVNAYPTTYHLYKAGVDVSDKYTLTNPNGKDVALTKVDTALPTALGVYMGGNQWISGKTCGQEIACKGYWSTNKSGTDVLQTHSAWRNGVWVNRIQTTDAASAASSATFGIVFLAASTPTTIDGKKADYEAIPDNTDISDTYTMEFSIA